MSKIWAWIIILIAILLIGGTAFFFYFLGQRSSQQEPASDTISNQTVNNNLSESLNNMLNTEPVNSLPLLTTPEKTRTCDVGNGGWCAEYLTEWGSPDTQVTSINNEFGQPIEGTITSWKNVPGLTNIAVLRNQVGFAVNAVSTLRDEVVPIGLSGIFGNLISYTDSAGLHNYIVNFDDVSGAYAVTFKFDHAPLVEDDQIVEDFINSWTFL